MDSSSPKTTALPLLLSLSLFFLPLSALAGVICEDLPQDLCAFAISSSSKRCVLESVPHKEGATEYQCQTSEVVVERMSDWIETDGCVRACGVDRNTIGISSDSLLEPQFTQKLCSPACHQSCPNIIDLYFNLAAAEGVFLPDLCEVRRGNPRRSMLVNFSSSGDAASTVHGGDASKLDVAAAPAPSPPTAA